MSLEREDGIDAVRSADFEGAANLEREHIIRPSAVFLMNPASLVADLFTSAMLDELQTLVDIDPSSVVSRTEEAVEQLQHAEIAIGGWGAPRLSPHDAPALRGLVYLGGVAALCLDDPSAWARRGLLAANARSINASPVAEFALAMILLDGKDSFAAERAYREHPEAPAAARSGVAGNHRRTIGIVGLSQVARLLVARLRTFDFDIVAFSPELTPELATEVGVRAATLAEVMTQSDVVSLHQPLIPATVGQIDARMLSLMRDGATLLNTARGAVVDQEALVGELRTGRIRAILDVTDPEPLPPEHELWSLPNAVLTPHIAGSLGGELHRMGENAVDEVRRFVAGEPFRYPEPLG
ncbi:hydroxyacid dehydrogenase [Microbacterium shaanxiense]